MRLQATVSQQTAGTSQRTAISTGPQTTASQCTFASNKPNESDTRADYLRDLDLDSEPIVNNPCPGFYRTNIDITPLSCDWENFVPWDCFTVEYGWHDLSEVDFFVKRVAKVRGEIRPLAFLPFDDPCIVFEAGGKYYFLNTAVSYLDDFGGDYASDDDFLKAIVDPHVERARFIFGEGTDDLYKAVDKEQRLQRRRAKAAEKLEKRKKIATKPMNVICSRACTKPARCVLSFRILLVCWDSSSLTNNLADLTDQRFHSVYEEKYNNIHNTISQLKATNYKNRKGQRVSANPRRA
ncbi:hypothetical protein GGX14DRAFT_627143 [Mycena pura]|uniref:Uncharacterized protein n=1 Tax=Mycena pura TaxID=153505 RepID=A0AAD6YQY8_9AGAR|nr:hypothetical protein GGX14DRAFT_627143 [Mycena pura]